MSPFYTNTLLSLTNYQLTEGSFPNIMKPDPRADGKHKASGPGAVVLVGTKADLGSAREMSYCEGVQLAERLGVLFLETSAKAGININKALFTLLVLVGRGRFSTKSGFTRVTREEVVKG